MREARYAIGRIVLGLSNAAALAEFEHLDALRFTVARSIDHFEGARAWDYGVFGAVLVAERMTANYYGLFPAGNEAGDAGNDYRFPEDGASPMKP